MPLHLLGKKSWNVYNQDNIERVRQDEAVARAKEEAEEEHMQEIDAKRRMQILRGEEPEPLPVEETARESHTSERHPRGSERERKKRKRHGEDDTDFELRLANEQAKASSADKQMMLRKPTIDAPLINHEGHIDLFPQEHKKPAITKNVEAEKEAAQKKKEYEDQYTLRFANAAGFKQGLEDPWYSKRDADTRESTEVPSKDVWGNEDPRRKQREAARIVSSDPLAAMRQGAAKVRQVERERKRWTEGRERELAELQKAEEVEGKRKRKFHDEDDLEGFSLYEPEKKSRRHRHERDRSHKSSHHRRRSSERERDRDRHRSRH
ncbi:MAG: hypothetical protein M1818_000721 [Claussenomyces sp. TS43310]|nr:MAG: hypothetical protein M1818_000721 [Claussenomyces sp. TS43310]